MTATVYFFSIFFDYQTQFTVEIQDLVDIRFINQKYKFVHSQSILKRLSYTTIKSMKYMFLRWLLIMYRN